MIRPLALRQLAASLGQVARATSGSGCVSVRVSSRVVAGALAESVSSLLPQARGRSISVAATRAAARCTRVVSRLHGTHLGDGCISGLYVAFFARRRGGTAQ